jgi:hypothetical protein
MPKTSITPEVAGKTLFDTIVDDRLYSNAMKLFGGTSEPIFEPPQRDTTMYSVLMSEIDFCNRNDLRILRIELMHFAFAYVDYLLMRSAKLHEEYGATLCFETVHWFVWEFKKRIEPLGKSQEFLSANEIRMRLYNEAWDQMLADGEKRNRMLIEEILFRFCDPKAPVINVALYYALQSDLLATQMMFIKFFETHRLHR